MFSFTAESVPGIPEIRFEVAPERRSASSRNGFYFGSDSPEDVTKRSHARAPCLAAQLRRRGCQELCCHTGTHADDKAD